MKWLDLPAAATAQGIIQLPGSKSISNRILLLAALADGATHIHDLLASDDTTRMLEALGLLGVSINRTGDNDYQLEGCNGKFPACEADLFLGNAGHRIPAIGCGSCTNEWKLPVVWRGTNA